MRTDLDFTHLTLVPGVPTRVSIEVTNTADVIDGVTAIIDGLDEDWITLDEPLVRLFPGDSGEVAFTVDVPLDCPAGVYLVVARIVSTISAERQSVQDFWVTVEPKRSGLLEVVPQVVTKRSKAELRTTVTNTGNTPTTFVLDAVDASGEVDCTVEPNEVTVGLAESAQSIVRLRGPRPWFGQVETRSIMLTAVADDAELTAVATFNQKPRISSGLLTFLTLFLIVALWATMFVFVIGYIRNQSPPEKASATEIAGGEQTVPLGKIAATAGGTARSSTQGEGLPRIAVQAYRVLPVEKPAEEQDPRLELFAEAVTGDDGTYIFDALLPGKYRLKFIGAGFAEEWYASDQLPADNRTISLVPKQVRAGLDVELEGENGAFRGQIGQPGADPVVGNFEVTATLIDPTAEPPPEPILGTVNDDNTYELPDLPAPNDYTVRIVDLDGNYATQEFVISVAAGEVKLLNPAVPSASPGELGGVVYDGDGNPLGGVAVTLRNGEFETESVTPTSVSDRGSFSFIGLATPATYVATFSLEGYTSQTIALELGPGKSRDDLAPRLIGGLGTINGFVVDPAALPAPLPLGAAQVTIEGAGFSVTTATLTDSGSTGDVGSFYVSGIPVPGTYSVTVSLAGYESVTVEARFGASGGTQSPLIELSPVAGAVQGIVTSGGAALRGVSIVLSNGLEGENRSTVSGSLPLGGFSFTDVAPGAYTVRFHLDGYQDYVRQIDVPIGTPVDASVTISQLPAPSLELTQSVDLLSIADLTDLTYTITVRNSGNVELTGVAVSNDLAGEATLTSGDTDRNAKLGIDEVWVYSATYTVLQNDIDIGSDLVNVASVVSEQTPAATEVASTTRITQTTSFDLVQTVAPVAYSGSGTLTFTITLTNTGNVELTNVAITVIGSYPPPFAAPVPVLPAPQLTGDTNVDGDLGVDEIWIYTVEYALVGSDFEAPGVTSTVRVVTDQVPGPITDQITALNAGNVG